MAGLKSLTYCVVEVDLRSFEFCLVEIQYSDGHGRTSIQ